MYFVNLSTDFWDITEKLTTEKPAIPNKCFINSPAAKEARLYYQAQAVAG
jgi:hypothetical protein